MKRWSRSSCGAACLFVREDLEPSVFFWEVLDFATC